MKTQSVDEIWHCTGSAISHTKLGSDPPLPRDSSGVLACSKLRTLSSEALPNSRDSRGSLQNCYSTDAEYITNAVEPALMFEAGLDRRNTRGAAQ